MNAYEQPGGSPANRTTAYGSTPVIINNTTGEVAKPKPKPIVSQNIVLIPLAVLEVIFCVVFIVMNWLFR